jgi:hypothetical protein
MSLAFSAGGVACHCDLRQVRRIWNAGVQCANRRTRRRGDSAASRTFFPGDALWQASVTSNSDAYDFVTHRHRRCRQTATRTEGSGGQDVDRIHEG